jgi:hypothetical protein
MSYASKFGATKIRQGKVDNLQINRDKTLEGEAAHPVLLYTPNMNDLNNHFHIPLTWKQAVKLKSWLDAYLGDPGRQEP